MKILIYSVIVFGIAGVVLAADEGSKPRFADSDLSKTGKIEKVIDGDTVIIVGGEVVRYIGIDTPERSEAYYRQAAKANLELTAEKEVRIQVCRARPRDKHGRTLASVYVGDRDITQILLGRGLGRVFTDSDCLKGDLSNKYWKTSRSAYNEAVGIWKASRGKIYKPTDTHKLIGRYAVVRGMVRNVHVGEKAVHINFGDNWKRDFSATIFKNDRKYFSSKGIRSDESLATKQVSVFGYVGKHYGPNIILHSPAQLKVE